MPKILTDNLRDKGCIFLMAPKNTMYPRRDWLWEPDAAVPSYLENQETGEAEARYC